MCRRRMEQKCFAGRTGNVMENNCGIGKMGVDDMHSLYKPKLIFFVDSTLLEGPCIHPSGKGILFVSIEQNCVYYLDFLTGIVKTYFMSGQVGCAVFEDDTHILVAEYSGIYRIDMGSGKKEFITHLIENCKLRYNDGKLDMAGRFLVGTTGYNCLAPNQNFLFSWDGKEKKILLERTTISNGIDFSLDNRYLYFVDTPTQKVTRYLYDIETGDIQFDRHIISFSDGSIPDGICRDKDDMLWVAQWGGYKVSKWNPHTGEKLMEIELPCQNVTSCCVGGEMNEWLFVTTAKHDDGTESEPLAGGLFKIKIR